MSFRNNLLVGLVLVVLVGCNRGRVAIPGGGEGEANPKPLVPVVKAYREKIQRRITLPGTVEGMETAPLYAKMGGEIVAIRKDFGDPIKGPVVQDGKVVTPGEVLAVLKIPELSQQVALKEAQLEKAETDVYAAIGSIDEAKGEITKAEAMKESVDAEVEAAVAHINAAQTTYNRALQMRNTGSIRTEVFDEARYKLASSQADKKVAEAKKASVEANLVAAKAMLMKANAGYLSALARVKVAEADLESEKALEQYTIIRAPFDGVVLTRTSGMDRGAFVQPAEGNSNAMPIFTVARNDVLRIFVHLPLSEVRWMRGDNDATLQLDALPYETFDAQVVRFSPSVDPKTKTMKVELRLKHHDARIYPGAYVTVKLDLVEYPQKDDPIPIVVPASAVFTEADGVYVALVEGGKVKRRKVRTFYEDGEKVGITEGLSEGESIIRAGGNTFREGQEVAVPDSGKQ